MIIDEFYYNVELYKRGMFAQIQFYDHYQETLFKFHKKQIEALELLNDNVCTSIGYGGAARGGKSVLMSLAMLFECYAYPETRYLTGRKDLSMFWGTTYKTLQRCMNNFGFEPSDFWHNKQKNEILFYGPKSEIIIKNLELKPSDKDATSFGSLEITKAYIDQSENVDLKIIEKVTERVGSHGTLRHNLKGKCFEAFNPLKTHVHKRFWLMFKQGLDIDSIKFVRALPTDNPSPEATKWVAEKTKDYQDGIMTKLEYEKQILGNFDYSDDDAALIKYDSIMNYWNGQHVERTGKMYLTIDVARKGKDKTVYRVWDGLVCIARFELAVSLTTEVVDKAKKIQEKYKITNSNTIADEDGVGGGVVDYLGCIGFVNNSRALNEENYANLKSQCSIEMAKLINDGKVVEFCNDRTVQAITTEEMEQVRMADMDKDSKLSIVKKEIIKSRIGRSPDEWDSIMMRYYFEIHKELWFS